jgi:hypothetical protein
MPIPRAPGGHVSASTAGADSRGEQLRHDDGLPDLGVVAHMSKRKKNREQEKAGHARTRHGVGFFVRVLVVGTILVVVIALAGDDTELKRELRGAG